VNLVYVAKYDRMVDKGEDSHAAIAQSLVLRSRNFGDFLLRIESEAVDFRNPLVQLNFLEGSCRMSIRYTLPIFIPGRQDIGEE
jgi:hypothetical protein